MNIKGSVAVITGAAGGIGRATMGLFAHEGWNVIGVDRNTFGEGFPHGGLFVQSDISRPEALLSIFGKAREFTETLDALVNNAAVQVAKPLVETSVEEWDEVITCLRDLRASDVDIVTLGQYLRPSEGHLPIVRYYTPEEFSELEAIGLRMGFRHVQAIVEAKQRLLEGVRLPRHYMAGLVFNLGFVRLHERLGF